jgi:hypothetical protein
LQLQTMDRLERRWRKIRASNGHLPSKVKDVSKHL